MRLLVDSHAFYWWIAERHRLSAQVSAVIADPSTDVFVSVATAWEMAIKVGSGKWPEAVDLVNRFEFHVGAEAFRLLPQRCARKVGWNDERRPSRSF